MDVKEAILSRRAYRSLEPIEINSELIDDISSYSQLSPSCFNYQPWRYVFVFDKNVIFSMYFIRYPKKQIRSANGYMLLLY